MKRNIKGGGIMREYTVYFSREMHGYKTFKADSDEKAEEVIADMENNGKFPDDFDSVKDQGWIFVDYDVEVSGKELISYKGGDR